MEATQAQSVIESLLLAADKPLTIDRVREVLGEQSPSESELKTLLEEIKTKFANSGFGFEIREALGGFQFCTKPENAEFVRRYFQTKPFRLGRSALEALAIIAYRQPITRAEIDQVRGIDSSHLLRVLMERGIVKMAGKAEVPGRPVQYATTPKFLELVGLNSLGELPPLSELEKLEGHTEEIQLPNLEDGLERLLSDTEKLQVQSAEQDKSMLTEIDSIIDTAQGTREIFESKEHAQVSAENELAVKEWQAFSKLIKKNSRRDRAHSPNPETIELNLVDLPTPELPTPMEAGTELSDDESFEVEQEQPVPTVREALMGDILPGAPNPGSKTPEPIIN